MPRRDRLSGMRPFAAIHDIRRMSSPFPSAAIDDGNLPRGSLLRRVLWFALLIVIGVTAISIFALHAVHTLQKSSDTLLQVAIPLQRDALQISALQQQAEFYERLAEVLPQQGYREAALHLLQQELSQLNRLQPKLGPYPQIEADVRAVQGQLQALLQASPKPLQPQQGVLDTQLGKLNDDLQQLFQHEAKQVEIARQQATWLMLALVFLSAILAALVSWRVKVSLTRPMLAIRAALDDIAAGKSALVAERGPPELRAMAKSISLMQERLEEEEKSRHVFLSQISHELKTPLASARSGADLLLSERFGTLDQRQKEILEIITRQMQELFLAIQEMLDLHALRARNLDCHIEALDPDALLREFELRFRSYLAQRNQQLEIRCHTQRKVRADPQRLLQIFSNLVTNACKYAPGAGPIQISVEDGTNGVHFSVRDYGKGIPEPLLERVFEEFFQVQEKGYLSKGTGLGLPIARELVEAQGGKIFVRNSNPGLVAEFWLPYGDT